VMGGRSQGRMAEDEITIADLTGVAVQDLAIATAVLKNV
ncbi:MAG: ornithine cyclodeaminase, partial [Deltaproteobacteria bacterium]|nr:ornithine cyclodeaminase [Deltaproteobacteria bacterium]